MPDTDIQAVLDGAAAELDAPITLEDRDSRLLAHTDHSAVIDEVRRSMIIGRRATSEVRAWFERWEPSRATRPFRTPADREIGVLERWCIPVRIRDVALGYLWVLDTRGIPEDQLGAVIVASDQIGALLYRRQLASQADADLLRLLLIPTPESEPVAAEARAFGTFAPDSIVAVIVAGASEGDEPSLATLGDLTFALQRAAEQTASETILAGVIEYIGVMLTSLRRSNDLEPAEGLAETVQRLASHVGPDFDIVAGIGGPKTLARASDSYVEARRALRIVRAMPDLGPIACWDDLGVFRALALLSASDLESGALDARVRSLLDDVGLSTTAEAFLDLAGDVQATSACLSIHRTTLYQRLNRIAKISKLDLQRNGNHRLIAHLGLKLARMTQPS